MDGRPLKYKKFRREKKIYKLLRNIPDLLEKDTQFRPLSINVGPEKGPDFVGLNKKGHLIIGEIKIGTLDRVAWKQVKTYGKKIGKMRQEELESDIYRGRNNKSLRSEYKGFLSKKAQSAFLNPSRRRIQLVLVAERFSDRVLTEINRQKMSQKLGKIVKDVKCLEVRLFKVDSNKTIVVSEIILGNKRKLAR